MPSSTFFAWVLAQATSGRIVRVLKTEISTSGSSANSFGSRNKAKRVGNVIFFDARHDDLHVFLSSKVGRGGVALVSTSDFNGTGLTASEPYVYALLRASSQALLTSGTQSELLGDAPVVVTKSTAFVLDAAPTAGSVQTLPLKGQALQPYHFSTASWRDEDGSPRGV